MCKDAVNITVPAYKFLDFLLFGLGLVSVSPWVISNRTIKNANLRFKFLI